MDESLKSHLSDFPGHQDVVKLDKDRYLLTTAENRSETVERGDVTFHLHGVYDLRDRLTKRPPSASWLIRSLAHGEPIKGRRVEEIIEQAKKAWSRGPRIAPTKQADRWADLNEALERLDKGRITADRGYLINEAFNDLVDLAYDVAGQWRPPPEKRIEGLDSVDSRVRKKARAFSQTDDPEQKFSLLRAMRDRLYETFPPPVEPESEEGELPGHGSAWTVFLHPLRMIADVIMGRNFTLLSNAFDAAYFFLSRHWRYLMTLLVLDAVAAMATLPIPFIVAGTYQSLGNLMNLIMGAGLLVLFTIVSRGIGTYRNIYAKTIDEKLWFTYQLHFIRQLISRPDLDQYSTGELSYRVSTDMKSTFNLTFSIARNVIRGTMYFLLLPFLFVLLPTYLVIHGVIVGLFVGSVYAVSSAAIYYRTRGVTRLQGQLSGRFIEVLKNASSIRSEHMENDAVKRVREKAEPLRDQSIGLSVVVMLMRSTANLIMILGPSALLVESIYAVTAGHVTAGRMVGTIIWLGFLVQPIATLFSIGPDLQRLLIRARRFFEIYSTAPLDLPQNTGSQPFPDYPDELYYTDVAFSYEESDEPLFEAHLKTPLNGLTCIVGPSGSGKTTFLELTNRLHRPSRGQIRIDDTPIQTIKSSVWRQSVVMVPEQSFFVEGSIRENMQLGHPKQFDADDMTRALSRVELWDDLVRRGGLDYELSETQELSAGEKRRLALARALMHDPQLLLVDEIVGALDPGLERRVMEILERIAVTDETPVFYVAHRPSAAKRADRILSFKDGEITKRTADEIDELYDL